MLPGEPGTAEWEPETQEGLWSCPAEAAPGIECQQGGGYGAAAGLELTEAESSTTWGTLFERNNPKLQRQTEARGLGRGTHNKGLNLRLH